MEKVLPSSHKLEVCIHLFLVQVSIYFHTLMLYLIIERNLFCDCEAFSFCSEACHSFCWLFFSYYISIMNHWDFRKITAEKTKILCEEKNLMKIENSFSCSKNPIGNVQFLLTSWQFCTLDGVLKITTKKANFT